MCTSGIHYELEYEPYIGEGFTMKPLNVLGGLNAMISLDIYKSASSDIENISDVIKADLLVIVSKQDHLVNPISSTLLALYELLDQLTNREVTGHKAIG